MGRQLMNLLAAIVLASWFLVFWSATREPDHVARPGLASLSVFSSIALAIWVLHP
jgi:hypothetical protein